MTNEQYQEEEPLYWEWNLSNQAKGEVIQRLTGISKGVVEAVKMSRYDPILEGSKNKITDFLDNGKVDMDKLEESTQVDKIFINKLLNND